MRQQPILSKMRGYMGDVHTTRFTYLNQFRAKGPYTRALLLRLARCRFVVHRFAGDALRRRGCGNRREGRRGCCGRSVR